MLSHQQPAFSHPLTPFEQVEFSFDEAPEAVSPQPAGISRIFLDWNRPLLHQAVDHLAQNWKMDGPLDLSDQMLIVSTQQSGRRLREALSAHAAEHNAAVLPPLVVTPDALLTSIPERPIAGSAEILRVWSDVLLDLKPLNFRSLFPVDPVQQDFSWALQTAADLLLMRATLGESGMTIAEAAANQASDTWREPERWRDLARIERAAMKKLDALQLSDPLLMRKAAADALSFGDEISKITLLAVPDPTPLALHALRKHSGREGTAIKVVIHAPESLADTFNEWGVPITEHWLTREIPIPQATEAIHLAPDPSGVARIATDLLTKHKSPVATAALAVCDESLGSLLEKECHHNRLPTYDPAGVPFERHEIAHLLRLMQGLLVRKAFSSFATLLRCPDFTQSLAHQWKEETPEETFSITGLLKGCDKLQVECLPDTIEDAVDAYKYKRTKLPKVLGFTLHIVQSHLDALRKPGNFNAALTDFLRFVYAGRAFRDQDSSDRAFVELASALDGILDQFDGAAFAKGSKLNTSDFLDILLRVLSRERVATEREPHSLDLQGWLESAWEDAPHLIVTGFNDRIVPEAITGDAFLPASARETLGLRTNEDRFARDAYYLSAVLACRPEGKGQVDFVLARAQEDGEPMRPSRLLFQCRDEQLANRALQIFQGAPEPGSGKPAAWTPAWKLNPPALPATHSLLRYLRVTDFSTYLSCPFRFYLKRGLKMEQIDTGRMEMDARNFGTIAHLALENFGKETSLRDCKTSGPIAGFLESALEEETTNRFGRRLPAPVVVQLDAAKQRLAAAARIFAAERRAGWHVEGEPEWSINENMAFLVGGLKIHGTIDRIERNEKTGDLRVIDFKTSAKPSRAESAHLSGFGRFEDPDTFPDWMHTENSEGKSCRWTNLQVPLYILALRQFFGKENTITGGYFNLPGAISEVGIDLWEELGEGQLRSAWECAEGVASSIKGGVFWPPNSKPKWDEFSDILFGLPEETASEPPELPKPEEPSTES